MDDVKILKSPWKSEFVRLVKNARKHIQLASPFIKENVASLIVNNAPPGVKIDYLNSFKLANFHRGASDMEALRILNSRNVNLRNYHQLHAKVFIFDGQRAVITSANLTLGGLIKNYEYGILIADKKLSSKIAADYKKIFRDKELTGKITTGVIDKASQILEFVPREKKQRFTVKYKDLFLEAAAEADRYEGGTPSIQANLKGWEKDVFDALNEIDLNILKLKDVYKFEDRLSKLHPRNKHVKDKIRQQLQVLRDLGLIEFLGGGVYRKLWQ